MVSSAYRKRVALHYRALACLPFCSCYSTGLCTVCTNTQTTRRRHFHLFRTSRNIQTIHTFNEPLSRRCARPNYTQRSEARGDRLEVMVSLCVSVCFRAGFQTIKGIWWACLLHAKDDNQRTQGQQPHGARDNVVDARVESESLKKSPRLVQLTVNRNVFVLGHLKEVIRLKINILLSCSKFVNVVNWHQIAHNSFWSIR